MLYKNTYRLKQVDDSDLPAIKSLFLKVFNKKVSLKYVKNKYNTSYLGIKYICTIAYHNITPIAFYGAIPQEFKNKNKVIFGAHACDSFTLNNHQRKGLHYELAKLAYSLMQQNNIAFVYAFHSENTYQSTKKLDWKEHIHLNRYHIKIPTLPIAKIVNKLNFNSIYQIFFKQKTTIDILKKINYTSSNLFTVNYSPAFIDYKNSFNTHYFISLNQCVFWIKTEAIIHVGLCYAPSKDALQKALKKLKRKALLLGFSEILFQVDSNSEINSQLRVLYSPKQSWLVGYLPFKESINFNNFIFSYADLDTF